jgi:DNA invertase Pin-like site-specific DNA recombinase
MVGCKAGAGWPVTGTSRGPHGFSSESLFDSPSGIRDEELEEMLTVAYCRVSTEEQAAEGFSITGQADKLRAYAQLHDLGAVTVVEDPGRSGKDLERPGLQQLLGMVAEGHVRHVLVWRLDRLSRNLGDLILLAERFAECGVGLHSFTEKLDLSSATGRMFYNILGAFAQFYREQLAENVRMGMQQAAREGRWTNRPKTGYSLVNGELVPNEDAPRVRWIFRLRAQGRSMAAIERATGIKVSTVRSILLSRVYLGEVVLKGQWFAGSHEALVSPEEWEAAHRGFVPGRRRAGHVLSGRVRCGMCGRVASVHHGRDVLLFRCWHRGKGCRQPARSARGLERAAVFGMRLVAEDEGLHAAIRRELAGGAAIARERDAAPGGSRRKRLGISDLEGRRRKLLELFYRDGISAEGFRAEEERIAHQIEALRAEEVLQQGHVVAGSRLAERFEEVARMLQAFDVDRLWAEASEDERRVLVEELIDAVVIFPDHLEVGVSGVPRLNVLLREVGLREDLSNVGVGGGV